MAETRLPFLPQSFEVGVEGPPYQVVIQPGTNAGQIDWPGTIAIPGTAGIGTFTSDPIPTGGMPHVAVSANLSTDGSLIVQPNLDAAGSIAAGAPTSIALTAGTLEVLDFTNSAIMGSVTISLINAGTVAGTLTDAMAILQAN